MYRRVVDSVLAKYGLKYKEVYSAQKGYRNESYPILLEDGVLVNLLFYKREPSILDRIQRADQVSEYTYNHHLPTRSRADRRTLRINAPRGEVYIQLYRYLPGKTIAWEAFTKKHIKLLGWAMSDLHYTLSPLLVRWNAEVTVYDEVSAHIKRMKKYWSDPMVIEAMAQKLHLEFESSVLMRLEKLIELCRTLPDQQVLHMDLVRGNVLFDTSSETDRWKMGTTALTGIIDFEKTSYGHPLFDTARTIAFLLVDCQEKNPNEIYRFFLYSGYNKRGLAHINMRQEFRGHSYATLLEGLVRCFLVYDFYKFLRHTPYESLEQNRHYVRTRDILLGYAMVRYPLEPRGK